MERTNTFLRPSQPYFVLDTNNYREEIYLKDGISHFYTFSTATEKPHRIVPDGCISIIFEYDPKRPGHMHSYVAGTKLQFEVESRCFHSEIFAVCFIPEKHPEMINLKMKDLIQNRYSTENALIGDKDWLFSMANETDFYKRIEIFTNYYSNLKKAKPRFSGKKELIHAIRQMVYQSNGTIKIHELEEKTRYSERYINKVFIEEMGFSPKIFCKIIQFQKALELFSSGRPKNMTEICTTLGYYDQSHFIRDFTKYCGITPLKYLKMQEEHNK